MDAYASKPFDPDQLFVLIQDCIAKRKANMDSGMDESRTIKLAESTPASGLDPLVTEPMRSGKGDLWQRLITIYSKTAPESMAVLERALSESDGATVSMTAHSLKSSSANMGAARLSYLLNQLETMARNANLEPAQDLMTEIRSEFDLVSLALASEGQSAPLTSRASA